MEKLVLSKSVHDASVQLCKGCLELFLLIISLLFQAEGPTVRDLKVRYSTGKKTSKNKKKLERAMKVLKVPQSQPPQRRHSHCCICVQAFHFNVPTVLAETQEEEKSRGVQLLRHSLNSRSTRYPHLLQHPPHLTATAAVQKKDVGFNSFNSKLLHFSVFRFFRETPEAAGRLERALRGEDHDDGAHIQTGWNP